MNPSSMFRNLSIVFPLLLAVCPVQAESVGYWNFNEGTGAVAKDFSPYHNDGSLAAVAGGNVPIWIAGKTGNPGDFALGLAQGNVVVTDVSSLHITNQFTMAAWVWDNGSNYGHVFSAGDSSTNRKWLLQTSGYGGDSNYFWSDVNGGFRRNLNYITPLGAWHHLAVTYDGANMKVYGDGVLKTTIPFAASLSEWATLHIGADNVNGSGLEGKIDDAIILNNAASLADIEAIRDGTYPDMVASVWNGAGTTAGWSDNTNWVNPPVTYLGSTVHLPPNFSTAAAPGSLTNSNDFAANTQFNGLTFQAGTAAFTLDGSAINLVGDVANRSANTQTIDLSLVLDSSFVGGSRNTTFNAASGDLVVNNGITQVATQTVGLVKTGDFTLKLNGTSNYTGPTNVNGGALLLNGATLGGTATTVSGSTSVVSGNGTVGGAVTAQAGGHLSPGIDAATIGTLNFSSGLTLNVATLDIKAAAPGSSDLVAVTGNLTQTGSTTLNLTQLAGFGIGDYAILTYTGTLGGGGQIVPPPADANYSYSIQTTGNQITLHVTDVTDVRTIPEIFYVSQSIGNDSNDGTTSPWKTLTKASSVPLIPGDQILLKRGDTWDDELQPKGNGTAADPIIISAYGTGNKPIIDRGDVAQLNGIHLIDQEGYKIVGLEFSHCETGIFAEYSVVTNPGDPIRKFVWIEDCYFHDSLNYGNYGDYYNNKEISLGICFWTFESYSNRISLQDITVKNCVFRRMASGIWTNSPDNFDYFADDYYNFANLVVDGCLFEEGYQWQLGYRGVLGGEVRNCVTHDIGRGFSSFNGVAGAMFYRTKDYSVTDSEWGFVSRNGGSSGDGEAFDLEGNNTNITFTRCSFHDTDGPTFMFFRGSNASNPSNTATFTDCVWNGKAALSNLGREEIFNASPGTAIGGFSSSRFYLAPGMNLTNNGTGLTFDPSCLIKNLGDAATGTNFALAATPGVSSGTATNGNDGNTGTAWTPASTNDEWLELDFGSATVVNEFRIREAAGSAITRYTIQYWDGAAWASAFNGRTMNTDPAGNGFIAATVSRVTTKVRLLVSAGTNPAIAEFEAYDGVPTIVSWRVGDGVWDINTTDNWKDGVGSPSNYLEGDAVTLDDSATGTSPITITLDTAVAPSNVTANQTKNYTITGAGTIGGVATISKSGGSTLTMAAANTYAGSTTVNGGTLKAGIASVGNVSGAFGNNSGITMVNATGAGLDITGFNTQVGSLAGGGSSGGGVTLGSANLTVGGDNTTTAYAGVISSSPGVAGVSLTKTGSGMLVLQRANTYTGKTVIEGGVLAADESNGSQPDAKLGAVPASFQADNITIRNGGALYLIKNTDGQFLNANRGILLDAGVQTINSSNGDFYINGVISGPGGLFHGNPGSGGYRRLYLNAANTFSGDTRYDASGSAGNYGGIELVNPLALQNSAFDSSSVGSWLGFNGNSAVTLGGLLGGGNLTWNGVTVSLNPGSGVTKTYTGALGGSVNIIKTGPGTQVFGDTNNYSGTTLVSVGTLLVGSPGSLAASSDVTVDAAGTLGGSGVVNGPVTAAGTIAPGDGDAGTLTTGAATLTGTLAMEIDGASGDKLVSTGALNISGTTLTVAVLDGGFSETSYVIAEGTSLTGTFVVPDGYSVAYTATQAILSQEAAAPYDAWALAKGLTGANKAIGDNPDQDRGNNLHEFGFNGDPLDGTDVGLIYVLTADSDFDADTEPELILTIATRKTAVFTGDAPTTSVWVDGVTYSVEGSMVLSSFPATVNVVPTAIVPAGAPDLSATDYE